jgi:hypothetical protein
MAETAERDAAGDQSDDEGEAESGRRRPDRDSRPEAARPGQRVGFFAAMKAATRPVHYVDDLRYLPRLLTSSPAIWLPAILIVAGSAIAVMRLQTGTVEEASGDAIFQTVVGFLISPYMPMIPAFIAGFFAPRASWLAGIIVALMSTVAFSVVASTRPEAFNIAQTSELVPVTLQLLTLSLPLGAVLAAASAWYKRFLELTSGAAAARQRASSRGRATRGRSSGRR